MLLSQRRKRRLAGVLAARLPDAKLHAVAEPRKRSGSWQLQTLLAAPIVGIAAGCKCLAEVEELTARISAPMRRQLRIPKRVPDTTMRDLLVVLDLDALREALWRMVRAALRRKALRPNAFPLGVATMDGRSTATRLLDDEFAQTHHPDGRAPYGLVRTMTSTLVSSRAKVCLDANPIPPETNEMGHFKRAFTQLVTTYSEDVFQIVTYDSGACSEHNGRLVEQHNRAYLFRLKKGDQPTIHLEAERLLGQLGAKDAVAQTFDRVGTKTLTRRLWHTAEIAGWHGWDHLRTVLRVETESVDPDGAVHREQRYFISSLRIARLAPAQWLRLVRMHWGVENNNHWVFDAILNEDRRPWILEPRGMLAVMLLRRIAFNLLALFRSVTQRSEDKRRLPWKTLLRDVFITLVAATRYDTRGLRRRKSPALV